MIVRDMPISILLYVSKSSCLIRPDRKAYATAAAKQAAVKPNETTTNRKNIRTNWLKVKLSSFYASPWPEIIMASSATRSVLRKRSDSDFNCPQAAKISRPRGVRIGEA